MTDEREAELKATLLRQFTMTAELFGDRATEIRTLTEVAILFGWDDTLKEMQRIMQRVRARPTE
jgi:hypothetical protein